MSPSTREHSMWISCSSATADHLSLIVEDDGVGFNPLDSETLGDGVGLTGMRERAALVGADLQIVSVPDQGTTVIVRVPAVASNECLR
jgi:signal transduction histidine kinase